MATTYFERTPYKSGRSAGLAAGRIQYITRTGRYVPAEARIAHQGREAATSRMREDLVHWDARNLPAWAKEDPVRYFSAAETHERANGVAYTEWRFSLPRELPRDQQLAAARDVLAAAFGERHPYVFALHAPEATDGTGKQPHVHVIWSSRTMDGIERSPAQFFRRYNRAHPERGGAEKAPASYHFGAVKAARVLYCDVMNMRLEQHLEEARLHPDTLRARGFDRAPEPRALPSDSNALKYKQAMTPTMQQVLDHRAQRGQYEGAELADAQRYWEARKQTLGITWMMPIERQLQGIQEAREQTVTRVPERVSARELGAQAQALEHGISGLERYAARLHVERIVEQHHQERGTTRSMTGQLRAERTLAEAREHGLPVEPASPARGVERVRHVARGLELDDSPQPGGLRGPRLHRQEWEQDHDRDGGLELGMDF